jgi:hypothetical protein
VIASGFKLQRLWEIKSRPPEKTRSTGTLVAVGEN